MKFYALPLVNRSYRVYNEERLPGMKPCFFVLIDFPYPFDSVEESRGQVGLFKEF